MKRIINKHNRGFGIIEVVVAVLLLVIITGAVLGLGRALLRNNAVASQRIQAYNYAREGLEMARASRDTTWINQSPDNWDKGFCQSGKSCYYTINNGVLTEENGVQTITADDGSIFKRSYRFTQLPESTKLASYVDGSSNVKNNIYTQTRQVKVIVEWEYSGQQYSVNLASVLTNWKPQI